MFIYATSKIVKFLNNKRYEEAVILMEGLFRIYKNNRSKFVSNRLKIIFKYYMYAKNKLTEQLRDELHKELTTIS